MTCLSPGNCFINIHNQLFDPNTVLKATLSRTISARELVAKYKVGPNGHILRRLESTPAR